jgi:hypothetical protein
MGRSRAEDRKLGEVKAVLEHLQRMAADPTSVGRQSTGETLGHAVQTFMRRKASLALLGGGALTSALVVGLAFMASDQHKSRPSIFAAAPSAPSTLPLADAPPRVPALQVAIGQMSAGHILAARKELLLLAPEDTVDVAWALARTYDPNFLATVPVADAAADVAEAARWYRTWHAVAVKEGLVGDSVSVDRIIGSMR